MIALGVKTSGVFYLRKKEGDIMKILAWMGLIITTLNVVIKLIQTFTQEKIRDRVLNFISTLVYISLSYFFIMYLFK
ncbi:hypothetical protein Z961_07810 [Clostridium haemolyticum NCTC 8350]|uniref:Uncharacterized protein n=2 Tax=Clostridium haemolyticum TaxID=84025 RepID=A0ABR4TI77_CLOHA|nr:hypothetical protein Z960_03550 [Clostridium haemolyticum NCTC 9693]KGN02919.1 hypothetical protein Z961_07810 [Clostridium haemolyticum NCTC 8350]